MKLTHFSAIHSLVIGFLTACSLECQTCAQDYKTEANRMVEITLTSTKAYLDPFNVIQVDALVTDSMGNRFRVPAFWAGKGQWRFRYASGQVGLHRYRTECSDQDNPGLHGVQGSITVASYAGDNPLYQHGPLRVSSNQRHFEQADGTPFLWLADTWWMGLCQRLHWPDEFQQLTADRQAKGFNVIQIVAGLYPDMPAFDPRGANEQGFPWETDYRAIRPEYFDAADRRLQYLADSGFMPCLVGAWGYHLPWLGVAKMKQHWRYLIARYAALPVVWCVAGEGTMPYYLSTHKTAEAQFQKQGWTEIAAYIRETDPFHRLVTIHPGDTARNMVTDVRVLDFDLLQTGHSDRSSIPNTIQVVRASRRAHPPLPTVNGEVCYEGILDSCYEDVQRFMVWSCLLSGTAGHTYGANGIWQVNREGQPYGASPHGGNWGTRPWNQAMILPGSRQAGLAKKLLEQYPWFRFKPHPEWATWASPPQGIEWGSWIWFPEGDPSKDAPAERRFFRKTFELPAGQTIKQASLRLSADDRFTVWLNGQKVGSGSDWRTGQQFDQVAVMLIPGKNVLAVEAANGQTTLTRNPAGLNGALEIYYQDGSTRRFITDHSWRCVQKEIAGWRETSFDDSAWTQAKVLAAYGQGPWGQIGRPDEFQVPYAAGIPGGMRIIYLPQANPVVVHQLEPKQYRGTYFNPITGHKTAIGEVQADRSGAWRSPELPEKGQDWVLILE